VTETRRLKSMRRTPYVLVREYSGA